MTTIWTDFCGIDLRQRFIDAGGIRTRCLEAGTGEPLVMLHGGGGHAEAYARNIPALSKRFHVYAIDMIGHGFTDIPQRDTWSFDELVRHLGDFQDAIGAEQIHLTGLSIGSMTSALYTGRNPHRVKALVLNTGVPLQSDPFGQREFKEGIATSAQAVEAGWTLESVRKRLGILFKNGESDVTDELVAIRHKIYTQTEAGRRYNEVVNDLLRLIKDPSDFNQKDGPAALRAIKCPTLVIWTPNNPGQGMPVVERAMKLLQNGRLVMFDKSGHWPQWEESEKYCRVVTEFLTGQ
jgi:2-hydroxy-6-oxonona-2,4-dienedioate hydrolase